MTYLAIKRPLRTVRQNPWVVIASFVSSVLVVCSNLSGIGWSWDSSDYVEVGRNIASGRGALDVIGKPMTVRPPGFPALLAVGDWLNISMSSWSMVINTFSAATVTICAYLLLTRANCSKLTIVLGTLFVAVAPPLLWQYSMAWSEPPFLAFEMTALVVALFVRGYAKYLALCGLLAALFFLRYVGPVFSVAIICSSVLLDMKSCGRVRALFYNLAALAGSLAPAIWWLLRNHRIDGTFTGTRQAGGGTFIHAFATIPGTVGMWIVGRPYDAVVYPSFSSYPTVAKFAVSLLGLVITLAAVLLLNRALGNRIDAFSSKALVFCGASAVVVFYSIFSAYRFVHWELGLLDNRMMIPIYVPLIILLALIFDSVAQKWRMIRIPVVVVAIALLATHAGIAARDALRFGQDGRHMAASDLREMPINQFLYSLPADSGFVSNEPIQLYFVIRNGPIFGVYNMDDVRPVQCDRRFVVWYKDFVIQDNKPDTLAVLYDDDFGTVFDAGTCDSDINKIWD